MIINKPSKDEIKRVFKLWDETREFENYGVEDKALRWLFKTYPKNTDLNQIILKIACLDSFYSTNLTMNAKIHEIAEKILRLKFDERVQRGDLSLVDELANSAKTKIYSFASKYCSWHNWEVYEKDDFVIFDSLVRIKLKEFNESYEFAKFSGKGLKENYSKYKEILEKFRAEFKLECDFKTLDKYLWRLGKLERLEKQRAKA